MLCSAMPGLICVCVCSCECSVAPTNGAHVIFLIYFCVSVRCRLVVHNWTHSSCDIDSLIMSALGFSFQNLCVRVAVCMWWICGSNNNIRRRCKQYMPTMMTTKTMSLRRERTERNKNSERRQEIYMNSEHAPFSWLNQVCLCSVHVCVCDTAFSSLSVTWECRCRSYCS